MDKVILKLKRQAPEKPGYPIMGTLVGPGISLFTLEDPLILKPELSEFYTSGFYVWHKIDGLTAIPAGSYRVYVTYSPTFKRRLPILVDVPNFTGIRIHRGNYQEDTRGCIIVGRARNDRSVLSSSQAEEDLISYLDSEVNAPVWVEVSNP